MLWDVFLNWPWSIQGKAVKRPSVTQTIPRRQLKTRATVAMKMGCKPTLKTPKLTGWNFPTQLDAGREVWKARIWKGFRTRFLDTNKSGIVWIRSSVRHVSRSFWIIFQYNFFKTTDGDTSSGDPTPRSAGLRCWTFIPKKQFPWWKCENWNKKRP